MIRTLARLLCLLAAAVPAAAQEAAPTASNSPEHVDENYVVLVSFDGFRHDYLDRIPAPAFERVTAAGVRADGLVPVFPSKTFPNHYSIATGMYAESHGLIDNNFWDPEWREGYAMRDRAAVQDGRWYGGEPIWVTAERQGMVTASYFFVGTEAPVGGVQPTYWRVYDSSVGNEERVDQALEWLSLPADRRPHLVLLYFSDVDNAGHDHGPASPEVEAAVRRVDRVLARLLDGLARLPIADRVHVVLVSDHGMIEIDRERVEYLDDHVPLDGVRVTALGPYATLWVGDEARRDRIAVRLRQGLRHARVWTREEIPDRLHYAGHRRAGDILILAEPGWMLARRDRPPRGRGMHGWDPAAKDMRGIFLAFGPRIRAGVRIPAFENVHVYPLIAELLGLDPHPHVDGRLDVLRPILSQTR